MDKNDIPLSVLKDAINSLPVRPKSFFDTVARRRVLLPLKPTPGIHSLNEIGEQQIYEVVFFWDHNINDWIIRLG